MDLAVNGWPDGLKRIQSITGGLNLGQAPLQEVAIPQPAESGDEVDVGRYLSGESECMIEFTPQFVPAVGRVIRIVANIAVECDGTHEEIFKRGSVAFALSDILESTGLRSEIWVVDGTRSLKDREWVTEVRVLIKRPDEQVEPDRLAFLLCHASVQRRLFFRIMEQFPDFLTRFGSNYGFASDIETEPEDIYIGALTGDVPVMHLVQKLVAKYLEPQPA